MVTLASGDRIQIRAVSSVNGRLSRYPWESDAAWYDPRRATANFVVLFPGRPEYPGFSDTAAVLATFGPPAQTYQFGPPAQTYQFGPYTVLTWHKNLLADLR